MSARRMLYAQLIVMVILAALHHLALEYYLYWRFLWLDLVAHALGGLWAGFFILWLRALKGLAPGLLWSVAGAFVLGIAWELFEVGAGIPRETNYTFDTSLDILMDVLGGVAAGIIALFLTKLRNPSFQKMV